MRKFYGLTLLSWICFASFIFGQTGLQVQDPRAWRGGTGTIEETTISVTPKGSFAEVSLYMTFSAKGLNFNHNDSLEVIYDFYLNDATFTDLWLWISEDISKALILDKWTASNIYENIVKRRRDPALLTKGHADHYNLRIYPLAGDEQRKIKMTYLIPADAKKTQLNIPLPLTLLRYSHNPLQSITVIAYPDSIWKNPMIPEVNKQFTLKSDSSGIEYAVMEIPMQDQLISLTLSYDTPSDNGAFAGITQIKSANYFQLIIPTESLDLELVKKVCIVVDYDKANSQFTPDDVLNNIKSLLSNYFTQKDSFNIVFSKTNFMISTKWLSAGKVDEVFENLKDPIKDESNLAQGLVTAIDFIHNNGNEGKILLIANSDEFDNYEKANAFLTEIKNELNPMIPVYIADFQTWNYNWYYAGDLYYRGNEYLYKNLSRITRGDYFTARDNHDFTGLINSAGVSLAGTITNFDISTSLQDGFTFGKFSNINVNQTTTVNKPIIQVGKYSGNLPLIVQVSGNYESKIFSKKIVFENAIPCDSTLEQFWTGNYINVLEKEGDMYGYENEFGSEIVEYSVAKRVLSRYSAFLALESNDTLQYCASCVNEGEFPVEVDEVPDEFGDTLKVEAYPNPFNSQTRIVVELPESYTADQLTMKIYDIVGQEVISFDPMEYAGKASFQLTWNGKNNFGESVASGIYLFVMQTPKAVKSLKLLNFK